MEDLNMPDNTDYTRLLDGYALVAIRNWVNNLLALKAPLASPTFTGTVTLPTSVKIGTSTATGLVKYTNGTLSIDTNSYKTDYRYRPIQVAGTEKIGTTAATALNFLNGTHSVQFTYSSGLYAEVNLANYKPNGSTAFLDSSNKVSASYLPDTVLGQLEYKGVWDATSTTTSTPQKGWYYICSVAGNRNPDGSAASVTYNVGDWAVYNGTSWDKVDNTDAITGIVLVSGAAKTGQVTIPAAGTDYGLIKTGYTSSGKNYKVQLDNNGNAYVNVPWTDNNDNSYHTPEWPSQASISKVKIATGVGGAVDMYLPVASATDYGLVKVAAVKTTAVTVNSLSTVAGKYYGIEMNNDGKLFVNVPWTDTKYSADNTTLSLSGSTFSIKSGYLATVATSGSYNDLSNKPTIPATNVIPVETTANKVLLSTTTSGTAAWSSWSTAGFLKTNASGVVSIDQNSYSLSNHTHTTTIATSSATNQLTLAFGTKYAITAGGTSYVFTMPANPNTDHYPTTFSWTNGTEAGPTGSLTGNSGFTAVSFGAIPIASESQSGVVTTSTQVFAGGKTFKEAITVDKSNVYAIYDTRAIALGNTGSSPSVILTLPTTTGTLALVGDNNHSHTLSIATDSGTNQLTLAFGTKYKLTAGGSTYVFTMPANPNTNTAHAHSAGTGLSISGSGGTSGTTTYSLKTATSSEIGGIAVGYTTSGKNYKVQLDTNGNAYVNVPWSNTTSFTITANATDGMFDITGTSGTNAVTYAVAPYASSIATSSWVQTAANYGKFYLGSVEPSVNANTSQLNYNGSLQVGAFKSIAAATGILLDADYGSGGAGIMFEISTREYCGTDSKVRIQDTTGSAVYLCVDGAPNATDGKFININTYSQTEATNILNGKNSDGTTI